MDWITAIATALACLYLPVPFIMIWLHAPRRVWRRIGRASYAIHTPVYLAMVAGAALMYRVWPVGAWPWHPAATIAGVVVIQLAFVILAATYRDIDTWTLMAGPELTPGAERAFVRQGAYSMIRHPRYLILMIGSLGNFLLTGYPLLLLAFVVTTLLSLVVIRMEEAELRESFGKDWDDYAARTPSLLPRWRW